MKILYISPENTAGTLNLWKLAHESKGNECTFITLFKSKQNFENGICLNLPLINTNSLYMTVRNNYYKIFRNKKGDYNELSGFPPIWEANSWIEKKYFSFRDYIWSFKIEPIIQKLGLLDYDIYHFEWGLDLYRDSRFVQRISQMDKPIICTYHGQDMRSRGVIPVIDKLSKLNLTSELDLMYKHPKIEYLFLPYDTTKHSPKYSLNKTIKVCHSPTNRYYKGSNTIISICEEMALKGDIEFILIENMPHEEAIHIKSQCDIFIDQIHNRGGWGYGMNSIEALSMGLCCITELVPEYVNFISDHPFINVTGKTLKLTLENLINNSNSIIKYKKRSRNWVEKYHDVQNVTDQLYAYYQKLL